MGSFWKNHENYVAGVILALLILLFVYLPNIMSSISSSHIEVPLCSYEGSENYKFVNLEKDYVGIPDFYVDTFITPLQTTVNENDFIQFSVRNIDSSLGELVSPYYYIFLYDRVCRRIILN